jgi:hypothetical protein
MHFLNLFSAAFCTFAAIFTAGYLPKWFTSLLWVLAALNVVLFLFVTIIRL